MEQIPIGADEHKVAAWGATEQGGKIVPLWIPRGNCGADDIRFELLYCGVCHTDVHQVKNDWSMSAYPIVPGHELAGRVVEVGANVTKV